MDFLRLEEKFPRGKIEISPSFIVCRSKDLMIKGKQFYAIWNPETNLWSTDQDTVIQMVDQEVKNKVNEEVKLAKERYERNPKDAPDIYGKYMKYSETGIMDHWLKYTQKQMSDNYHCLNQKLIFANTETKKTDYATFKLPYRLEEGDHSAWDQLVSVLYSDSERHKIEWGIGSVVTGASRHIQKFFVFYGSGGTGKSTILKIIAKLFDGYWKAFKSYDLGISSKDFAMEPFADNPLLAIEQDGDLSRIEDNTRLNSIISHEDMMINEKFTHQYTIQLNTMIFMGTNKPVKITDSKSGLIRRLIDIRPTGQTIPETEYNKLLEQIDFELGAIAYHCAQVYNSNPRYYNGYVPELMFDETNDMYNFMEEYSDIFTSKMKGVVPLSTAWQLYNTYVEDARVKYPMTKRAFKTEMRNYFKDYAPTAKINGSIERSVYKNFNLEKFFNKEVTNKPKEVDDIQKLDTWIQLGNYDSAFDTTFKDCPAQYAVTDSSSGQIRPKVKWANCRTTLMDIDTDELHYVKTPSRLIMIDFDIKGDDGKKSLEANILAASKWPPTYCEVSKSGSGIHLYYWYDGDISKLSATAGENIEVKTFPEEMNSAIRRKLTKCNDRQIAKINSGLPMKVEEKKVINKDIALTERSMKKTILSIVNKEYPNIPSTISGCMLIKKILNDAYEQGKTYDLSNLYQDVLYFASGSHNHALECKKMVAEMHFQSDDTKEEPMTEAKPALDQLTNEFTFYDIEVFSNLLLVCYLTIEREKILELVKIADEKGFQAIVPELNKLKEKCVRLYQPDQVDIAKVIALEPIGFYCRKYDNHVIYGRYLGLSNAGCYELSQKLVSDDTTARSAYYANAWDISKTDVYDFSSKKQSLKKFEIELGMYHVENEYPWDQPLDESHWKEIGDYCCNDVVSTLGVFIDRFGDWTARKILSALSGLSTNVTTNQHTTRIIFGKEKNPSLIYTDLATGEQYDGDTPYQLPITSWEDYQLHKDDWKTQPAPYGNCFPGYFYVRFKDGTLHNMYRGTDLGFGGYVYANPGMYIGRAITKDVASEHPHSIYKLNLFGKFTKNFTDLMDARIFIKHKEFDKAKTLFDGKLTPYLTDPKEAKALSKALKIAINSVYGLSSAKFMNPFRDARNVNNIVALRGALFMKTVQDYVESKGFKVIHIKTDSIKIFQPTDKILDEVQKLGESFGYEFETEHIWDRICLVNSAVFIGKHASDDPDGPGAWDAVGTQFQIPYVYKSLFSHEPITFEDMCETKSVNTALYLDFNEGKAVDADLELAWKLRGSTKKSYTKHEQQVIELYKDIPDEELWNQILKHHHYTFVGKVGLFCPMKEGCGAGELVRMGTDRKGRTTYSSATGANWTDDDGNDANRWLEAMVVKSTGKEKDIDRSYYRNLVDEAKASMEQFGSFEDFVA